MEKHLFVVGIGPGTPEKMTMEADGALRRSEVIVGYQLYVGLVKERYPEAEFLTTGMRKERERCRLALKEADQGRITSVVCSGDSGVYGMAGLILEMRHEYPEVQVQMIPGVTAALSGSAVLGSPLGHDFCCISLSDLMTPWELIEKRLRCAGEADFAIALYNPASRRRTDYLRRAAEILMESRSPETVCGVNFEADMLMTVFVGNSMTRVIDGRMVTPRGYIEKYGELEKED